MQVRDGFGWVRVMLRSTIPTGLDASSVGLLTSVLDSLETVGEFLVISLKTNLAHDTDTLVLSFSNRLDRGSSLVPRNSTTNVSLAPEGEFFLATKCSDRSRGLTVRGWSLFQH